MMTENIIFQMEDDMNRLFNYWTKEKGNRPDGLVCEQETTAKKWYSVVTYARKLSSSEMEQFGLVYKSST